MENVDTTTLDFATTTYIPHGTLDGSFARGRSDSADRHARRRHAERRTARSATRRLGVQLWQERRSLYGLRQNGTATAGATVGWVGRENGAAAAGATVGWVGRENGVAAAGATGGTKHTQLGWTRKRIFRS